MSKFEKGMLVKSLAGHDAGEVYIIVETLVIARLYS